MIFNHSLPLPEYVDNLKDEGHVCGIIDRLLGYLETKGSTEEVCRVYLRRIMHTYYKFDYKAHRRALGLQGETKVRKRTETPSWTQNYFQVMGTLNMAAGPPIIELEWECMF